MLSSERAALRWIKHYIGAFGGNSSQITMYVLFVRPCLWVTLFTLPDSWGQSAGAISVSLQMLAYDGNNEDLFHGAFMQSGAPIPVGNITEGQVSSRAFPSLFYCLKAFQKYYDQLVNGTNCGSSNNTLDCLRSAPLSTLSDAINQTPGLWSYQVCFTPVLTHLCPTNIVSVVACSGLDASSRWNLPLGQPPTHGPGWQSLECTNGVGQLR
jgi:carboxylesterase type B